LAGTLKKFSRDSARRWEQALDTSIATFKREKRAARDERALARKKQRVREDEMEE
jgi:hypothetical protein